MKLIIGTVTALATVGIAAGIGYVVLSGDGPGRAPTPHYTTQAALVAAVPARAADTLRERGHVLGAPLACRDLPGVTPKSLRLTCTGTTVAKKKVRVIAAAEPSRRRQYFTVLVSGRPLVQNVTCLGADCRRKRAEH